MKQWEMDKLRNYCDIMRKIGDPVWSGLYALLNKFDVEPDVVEDNVEEEWDKWLSTAPDPLTEYDNSYSMIGKKNEDS